jgi:hypothetical protein
MSGAIPGTTIRPHLSAKNRIGLVIAGLLGLVDILFFIALSFIAVGSPPPGQNGPPAAVLMAGAILGTITLLGVIYTWRTANRAGARVVAGSRILSTLGAMPAFFVGGVPAGLLLAASANVIITAIAVFLVLTPPAPPAN